VLDTGRDRRPPSLLVAPARWRPHCRFTSFRPLSDAPAPITVRMLAAQAQRWWRHMLQVGVLLENLCHRGGAALVAPTLWRLGTRARGDIGAMVRMRWPPAVEGKVKRRQPLASWGRGRGVGAVGLSQKSQSSDLSCRVHAAVACRA
jgi:hypothetical protein